MRIYKTGDLCPCCGKPIRLTDPQALQVFSTLVDMMSPPADPAEEKKEHANVKN